MRMALKSLIKTESLCHRKDFLASLKASDMTAKCAQKLLCLIVHGTLCLKCQWLENKIIWQVFRGFPARHNFSCRIS